MRKERDELAKENDKLAKENDKLAKERDELAKENDKLTKERYLLKDQRDNLQELNDEMVTLSECEKFMTDILPVCPVTLEIPYRPVVTNTGVTLDKPSYDKLLAERKLCPITRQPLTSSTPVAELRKFIYNLHLKKIKNQYVMPAEKRALCFVRLSMESKAGCRDIDKGEVRRHADEAMAEYKAMAESKNTNIDVGLCQMHEQSHIDFDQLDDAMLTLIQKALDEKRRENDKRDMQLEELEGTTTDDDDFDDDQLELIPAPAEEESPVEEESDHEPDPPTPGYIPASPDSGVD